MQEKITYKSGYMSKIALLAFSVFITMFSSSAKAQIFCANETTYWTENFGTGTTPSTNSDVINLAFSASGNLADGFYRVINSTQQKPEWHVSPDHTGNTNGKMLVVNGSAETFYRHVLLAPLPAGNYSANLFLMNINTPGTCGSGALLPTITFEVEYSTTLSGNNWISLQNYTAPSIPQTATPTWNLLGGVFAVPVAFERIRLTLTDGVASGCGNDFAIDDIRFSTCPSGGPLPVKFSAVNAIQKGTGVNITWSTETEANSKYFDVERSTNGVDWVKVGSVGTTGNSSVTKNYQSYDPSPVAGVNYYRIKNVDNDGFSKNSSTVKVIIKIDKATVSVINNPFVNNLSLDFLAKAQNVNVRIADLTGKVLVQEKWSIGNGHTIKSFMNVSNLSRGMYILTVMDETGSLLFNTKVVKQ